MKLMNLGYIFYRNIAQTDDINFGKEIVDKSTKLRVDSEKFFGITDSFKLSFKTIYPGMTLGLGYSHDPEKQSNDDFKLGFMFDYTTGLPYIPGSSIKGVIRSMFPFDATDMQRINFINAILGTSYDYASIYALEQSIFGKKPKDSNAKDSPQTKDIFYDGYFATASVGGFLDEDYITPHKEEFLSPDPLKFLKISPSIKVVVQFGLQENELISKEERTNLYSTILEYTGIGAKTNVGYGAVDNIKYTYRELEDKATAKALFEAITKKEEAQKKDDDLAKLPEHERIAKEHDYSTKAMMKILEQEQCSIESRKALATLIKQKLMEYPATWKNAKKKALKNKEFIESVLKE